MRQCKFSVAIEDSRNAAILKALVRHDGQEDLRFALYSPSTGETRYTACLNDLLEPEEGDRQVHGNASFNSTYFEKIIEFARKEGKGIIFMHSHPTEGWQLMSEPDVEAELGLAKQVLSATGFPLVGMTVGTDGVWSARFWVKDESGRHIERIWCDDVRVIGAQLLKYSNPHLPSFAIDENRMSRTLQAWGHDVQRKISDLKVGIIGCGSVGSTVALELAKIGVRKFLFLDFDTLEYHNLDRTLVGCASDTGRSKALILEEKIREQAVCLDLEIEASEYSVCEELGCLKALDCDVNFSCVDRPWPRQVLNFITHAHLIPLIDGGIHVTSNSEKKYHLQSAEWRFQAVVPETCCLECSAQFSSADAKSEKEGLFDDPSYIETTSLEFKKKLKSQNVFAFSASLAAFEVQLFLKLVDGLSMPLGSPSESIGPRIYHFKTGMVELENLECADQCYWKGLLSKGDLTGIITTGVHYVAEAEREARLVAK